ncbi:MAG: TolB family protein [Actinomycetota bacterium]
MRPRLASAGFICLVLLALALPASAASNGRWILYGGYGRNTPYHVFKVRLDGTRLQRLSPRGGGLDPSWAPGGRRISYATDRGIVVARAGGSRRRIVARNGIEPRWSPDGRRLLFARWCCVEDPERSAILMVRRDGSGLRRLARAGEKRRVEAAQWAPKGRRVSYLRAAQTCSLDRCPRDRLVIVNPSGEARRVLLRRHGIEHYDWSPDGSRIVFSCRCGRDQYDLFVVDVATEIVTRITRTATHEDDPDWSPDGGRIVAVRWAASGSGWGRLVTLDPDGSSARTVTRAFRGWPSPSWSPDGSRIVFLKGEWSDIFVVDADGGRELQVTDDPRAEVTPTWQPR